MQINSQLPSRQQGAVLIIAMVLLLVMSLIGLSSVVSSTLQEKMASNSQQRALSRYAAESALRAAEAYLTANINATSQLAKFDGTTNGLYAAYPVPGILFINDLAKLEAEFNPSTKSVSEPESWEAGNSVEVLELSAKVVSTRPRYAIEYVGRRSQGGTPVWSPSGPIERGAPHIFKITAIGWGRDPSVYSVLQSHFMTGQGPGVFEYEE